MTTPPTTLFVAPHMGVGDAIICNALVRELARRHTHVVYPVLWRNRTSLAWMWADLPVVTLLGVDGDKEVRQWLVRFQQGGTLVLRLGTFNGTWDRGRWDRQFYEQAGVPFEQRWTGFRLPGQPTPATTPTVTAPYPPFLHEDPARGYRIDHRRVPPTARQVPRARTVFEMLGWLQGAPEIHVIDSAFLCLADSVETKATRLVLHRYARPNGNMPTLRKKWKVLQ